MHQVIDALGEVAKHSHTSLVHSNFQHAYITPQMHTYLEPIILLLIIIAGVPGEKP